MARIMKLPLALLEKSLIKYILQKLNFTFYKIQSKMDRNDITQIRGMFPCLIRYLPNDIGYLMENLSIYRLDGNKYSHYIEFVMLEESRLYDIGFDTVALRVYMRKSKDGSIKYKHERFIFAPEKGFHIGNEMLYRKYEDLFVYWWQTVRYVLYSKQYAESKMALIKKELLAATNKQNFESAFNDLH